MLITLNVGDEVLFGGKRFTLIERMFSDGIPMWNAVETDRADAKLRLLVEADLKPL